MTAKGAGTPGPRTEVVPRTLFLSVYICIQGWHMTHPHILSAMRFYVKKQRHNPPPRVQDWAEEIIRAEPTRDEEWLICGSSVLAQVLFVFCLYLYFRSRSAGF